MHGICKGDVEVTSTQHSVSPCLAVVLLQAKSSLQRGDRTWLMSLVKNKITSKVKDERRGKVNGKMQSKTKRFQWWQNAWGDVVECLWNSQMYHRDVTKGICIKHCSGLPTSDRESEVELCTNRHILTSGNSDL